jgi:protein TIF31
LERLHAAQARVAATTKRRLTTGPGAGAGEVGVAGSSAAGAAAAAEAERKVQEASRIGVKGHLEVDELVKFITGEGEGPKRSSKNALRGKRRTGAKR